MIGCTFFLKPKPLISFSTCGILCCCAVFETYFRLFKLFLILRWQAAIDMTGRPIPGRHWLQINLGRPYHICGVVIDWEDAFSDHWQIVGRRPSLDSLSNKNDGKEDEWVPLFSRKDAQVQSKRRHIIHDIAYRSAHHPNHNRKRPDHHSVISNVDGIYPSDYTDMVVGMHPAVQAVRLNIISPSTQWGSSVWRLQVYGFEPRQG